MIKKLRLVCASDNKKCTTDLRAFASTAVALFPDHSVLALALSRLILTLLIDRADDVTIAGPARSCGGVVEMIGLKRSDAVTRQRLEQATNSPCNCKRRSCGGNSDRS